MSGLLDRIFPSSGASSQPKDTRTSSPNVPDPESGETGVMHPGDAGLPGQAPPGGGLPGQAPPFGAGPGVGSPGGAGLPGQAPPGGAGAATGGPSSPDEGTQQRKGRLRRRRASEPDALGPDGPAGHGPPTAGTSQLPAVPEVSLEPAVLQGDALDSPGFASRPKLRRRLRYLRKLRELLLRDLGGFVFDARRFQRPRDDLVAAKIQRLAGLDKEIGALESALEDRRPFLELREPGIGGMCERCGAFFSSTSRFCSECGASLGAQGHSVPAAAGPPPPVAPAAPATRTPARRSSSSSAPAATPSAAAPPTSQAARLAAEAAANRGARPAGQPPAGPSPAARPPADQPSSGGLWSAPAPKPREGLPAPPTEAAPGAQAPGAAPPQGGDPRSQDDPTGPSSLGSGDPLQRR